MVECHPFNRIEDFGICTIDDNVFFLTVFCCSSVYVAFL